MGYNINERQALGMCTKLELTTILNIFAKSVREVFGDKLSEVVLFGSYAGGGNHDASDIDIMIVADIEEDAVMKYMYEMSDFLSELSLEYEVMISPVIEPLSRYERYKDVIPFLQNVQREGIRIAA